jgi:hypothetical protein
MFRRFVSLLVLIGFLANQLAAIPHAHAGYSEEQQRQHDAQPHVHVGRGNHAHHHGHSHDQPSDRQPAEKHSPVKVPPLSSGVRDFSVEYDLDAIYLPSSASLAVKDPSTANAAAALFGDLDSTSTSADLKPRCLCAPIHPPNRDARGAKLYLILRALRI